MVLVHKFGFKNTHANAGNSGVFEGSPDRPPGWEEFGSFVTPIIKVRYRLHASLNMVTSETQYAWISCRKSNSCVCSACHLTKF